MIASGLTKKQANTHFDNFVERIESKKELKTAVSDLVGSVKENIIQNNANKNRVLSSTQDTLEFEN